MKDSGHAPVLVYDGGCLFCSHFAQLSELRSGIPELRICDGRSDHALRAELNRRGAPLHSGAVIINGEQLFHGAEAIEWLCARMQPSAVLLQLLSANLLMRLTSMPVFLPHSCAGTASAKFQTRLFFVRPCAGTAAAKLEIPVVFLRPRRACANFVSVGRIIVDPRWCASVFPALVLSFFVSF